MSPEPRRKPVEHVLGNLLQLRRSPDRLIVLFHKHGTYTLHEVRTFHQMLRDPAASYRGRRETDVVEQVRRRQRALRTIRPTKAEKSDVIHEGEAWLHRC